VADDIVTSVSLKRHRRQARHSKGGAQFDQTGNRFQSTQKLSPARQNSDGSDVAARSSLYFFGHRTAEY
jgi:hypothetical protein